MIKIKNLFVTVSGQPVLSGINMEIKRGKSMALLGPNGSGKTSLIKTIMGFANYRIEKGEIIFKDKVINGLPVDERARLGIGILFQRPPTIRGVKMRQMVELIKKGDFDVSRETEALNLKGFMDRDINMDFSGGEIKRSELLQLLASSPSLTLFDEPESGVDLENIVLVGKVMNRIIDRDRDNSCLIITHTGYILDYVRADSGCVLAQGKLHCLGDPRKILQTVKQHGYQWCVTCQNKKPREK